MTRWSWLYLGDDLRQMLHYPFMVNALVAGGVVAVVSGLLGWFVALRREAFAAHTLSLLGFPGAAAATFAGLDPAYGFFGAAVLGAALIAAAGRRGGVDDSGRSAAVALVQAGALATGLLFVGLYGGFLSSLQNLLFGSITGIARDQLTVLAVVGGVVVLLLAVLGRPLLLASVDPVVAAARGVPVGLVGTVFLLLVGLGAAGASQVTGSLLVYALLVAPAATAVQLTTRPLRGVALSVLLALAVTWAGETTAFFTDLPIGFAVTSLAFAGYLLALGWRAVHAR